MDQGYRKLGIYQTSHQLAVRLHKMTMALPKHEMYEEGSQLRRSSKSVSSNIVEGYALRRYRNEWLHYLTRSYASALETMEHLEYVFETDSLTDADMFRIFQDECDHLIRMLFNFIQSVEKQHEKPNYLKEPDPPYDENVPTIDNPQSTIDNPQSTIDNPQSTIDNPQSTIDNPQSTIDNPQSTIEP